MPCRPGSGFFTAANVARRHPPPPRIAAALPPAFLLPAFARPQSSHASSSTLTTANDDEDFNQLLIPSSTASSSSSTLSARRGIVCYHSLRHYINRLSADARSNDAAVQPRRRNLVMWLARQNDVRRSAAATTKSSSSNEDKVMRREHDKLLAVQLQCVKLDADVASLDTLHVLSRLALHRRADATLRVLHRKLDAWIEQRHASSSTDEKQHERESQSESQEAIAKRLGTIFATLMQHYTRTQQFSLVYDCDQAMQHFVHQQQQQQSTSSSSISLSNSLYDERHFWAKLQSERRFRTGNYNECPLLRFRSRRLSRTEHETARQKARNRAVHSLQAAAELLLDMQRCNVKPSTRFFVEFTKMLQRCTATHRLVQNDVAANEHVDASNAREVHLALETSRTWNVVREQRRELARKCWRMLHGTAVDAAPSEEARRDRRDMAALRALLHFELCNVESLLEVSRVKEPPAARAVPAQVGVVRARSISSGEARHAVQRTHELNDALEFLQVIVRKFQQWLEESLAHEAEQQKEQTDQPSSQSQSSADAETRLRRRIEQQHLLVRANYLALRLKLPATTQLDKALPAARALLAHSLPPFERSTQHEALQRSVTQVRMLQRSGMVLLCDAMLRAREATGIEAALRLVLPAAQKGLFDYTTFDQRGPVSLARIWGRALGMLPMLPVVGATSAEGGAAPARCVSNEMLDLLVQVLQTMDERHTPQELRLWTLHLRQVIVQPKVVEMLVESSIRTSSLQPCAFVLKDLTETQTALQHIAHIHRLLRARGTMWNWVRTATSRAVRSCAGQGTEHEGKCLALVGELERAWAESVGKGSSSAQESKTGVQLAQSHVDKDAASEEAQRAVVAIPIDRSSSAHPAALRQPHRNSQSHAQPQSQEQQDILEEAYPHPTLVSVEGAWRA